MKVGAVTIGQSPRDDVVPEIQEMLGPTIEIIEMGALDGLSLTEVQSFSPAPTDYMIVTRMNDGTEVKIAKKHIIQRFKNCIFELEENGAEILMLLCTGEFQNIQTKKILLQPNRIMRNSVKGLLPKGTISVIVPSPEQIPAALKKWKITNINVISAAVSPYSGTEKDLIQIANKLKNSDLKLIILDCIGYNKKIKTIFTSITKKPVLLPRTMLASFARELADV